jgi:uncharacterized protein (UPF0335 family)
MEIGSNSREQLKSLVDRVERLKDEQDVIGEDIKEVLAEAKGNGFDAKTIRKVVAIRRKGLKEHSEETALVDLYCKTVGMEMLE